MPTMTDATCSRSRRRNACLSEIAFSGWLNRMTSSTASGPLALLIGLGILALSKKKGLEAGGRVGMEAPQKGGGILTVPKPLVKLCFPSFAHMSFPREFETPTFFLSTLAVHESTSLGPRDTFWWTPPRCCKSGRSAGRPQAIMPRPGLQREEKGQRSAPNLHTRVQLVQLNPAA